MKISNTLFLLLASAASVDAFGSFGKKAAPKKAVSADTFAVEDLPGILDPIGLFDPLGLATKATPNLLRKYREAELTHGRIAMLATVGFLVGEGVQGAFPGAYTGSGLNQLGELPGVDLVYFFAGAFAIETQRVRNVIFNAATCDKADIGKYKLDSLPGDLGFDPFGLKPANEEEFRIKQTKELQNGRLAMIAASGFLAQELVDNKGIIEHVLGYLPEGLSLPSLSDLPLPF